MAEGMGSEIKSPRALLVKAMPLSQSNTHVLTNASLPTPNLPSVNVQRLEKSAARLSMHADIGQGIRMMNEEQKRSGSRSPVRSSRPQSRQRHETLSRHSSRGNNSVHSQNSPSMDNRWSTVSQRKAITHPEEDHQPNTRPSFEYNRQYSNEAFPQLTKQSSGVVSREGSLFHFSEDFHDERTSRRPIDGGDTDNTEDGDDGIIRISSNQSKGISIGDSTKQVYKESLPVLEQTEELHGKDGNLLRADSSASRTMSRQPSSVFRDFDGVHSAAINEEPIEEYDEEVDEGENTEEHREEEEVESTRSSMKGETPMPRFELPPPTDGMVYYPAPVPMMLNIPKRLTQQTPINLQAQTQRRSRAVDMVQYDTRRSTTVLPDFDASGVDDIRATAADQEVLQDRRRTMQQPTPFSQRLPPQLRASVFFDTPTAAYEVEIQNGSAVNTLDALLDASASAPVDRLTSHKNKRKSKMSKKHMSTRVSRMYASRDANNYPAQGHASLSARSSVSDLARDHNALDAQRLSHATLSARSSTYDLARSRHSKQRLSLVGEQDEDDSAANDTIGKARHRSQASFNYLGVDIPHAAEGEEEHETEHPAEIDQGYVNHDLYANEEYSEEFTEGSESEEDGDGDPFAHPVSSRAPATLLAELQLRKQALKERTRAAATAFPNGMHATLLQLEAVAQLESKRRQGHHTYLAWEDPLDPARQELDKDEDVPLGMLYPPKGSHQRGISDWDSPLAVVERQNREDSEPLSMRRNRLLGINPVPQTQDQESEEEDPAEAGETLAQRTRRLKSLKALDDAIDKTTHSRSVSQDFKTEMMSQLGGDLGDEDGESALATGEKAAVAAPIEESLGQRRERLRAEAALTSSAAALTLNRDRQRPREERSLASLLGNKSPINASSQSYTHHGYASPYTLQPQGVVGAVPQNTSNASLYSSPYMSMPIAQQKNYPMAQNPAIHPMHRVPMHNPVTASPYMAPMQMTQGSQGYLGYANGRYMSNSINAPQSNNIYSWR